MFTISAADRDGAARALKDGESKLDDAASELDSMKPPEDAAEPTQLLANTPSPAKGHEKALQVQGFLRLRG